MSTLKGCISVLLLLINTLFWGMPLIVLTAVKLATPIRRWRLRVPVSYTHLTLPTKRIV